MPKKSYRMRNVMQNMHLTEDIQNAVANAVDMNSW